MGPGYNQKLQNTTNVNRFIFYCVGVIFISALLIGCKSKEITVAPKKIKHLSVGRVTRLVKENSLNYETLSVKKVNLSINNDGKSVSARGYFKIRRDSVIQVSAQKLAIPVGKLEIKTDSFRIVYYLEQENIFGSFEYIRELLGLEVDFEVVQSILTGQLFSIRQDARDNEFRDFTCDIEDDLYKITSITDRKLRKIIRNEDKLERYLNRLDDNHLVKQEIYIDPENFVVRKMIFHDMDSNRSVKFDFSHFEKIDNQWFPGSINVDLKGEKTISASMELSKISINDDWNFSFSTSSKYKNKFLQSTPMESAKY